MMPSLRPTMSTLSGGFNEVTGRYMIDAISSRKALTLRGRFGVETHGRVDPMGIQNLVLR
jgi:hypothetical protein